MKHAYETVLLVCICVVAACLLDSCANERAQFYLVNSVRRLAPELQLNEVRAIFRQNEHVKVMYDKAADKCDYNMDRQWSTEAVRWVIGFTEDITDAGCIVYFDSTSTIIGFLFSAPNGPQLRDDELVFP